MTKNPPILLRNYNSKTIIMNGKNICVLCVKRRERLIENLSISWLRLNYLVGFCQKTHQLKGLSQKIQTISERDKTNL